MTLPTQTSHSQPAASTYANQIVPYRPQFQRPVFPPQSPSSQHPSLQRPSLQHPAALSRPGQPPSPSFQGAQILRTYQGDRSQLFVIYWFQGQTWLAEVDVARQMIVHSRPMDG